MMKKAVNEYCVGGKPTRRELFASLKNAGFEGVEFNISEPMSDTEKAEIKSLSKEFGIEIVGFVSPKLWEYNLTSPDAENREKAKETVKMLVRHAEYFGCDSILVVPGKVTEEVSYKAAWDNASLALKELIPFIQEHKVNVCIENVWNKFLVSAFDMANFVDSFCCPYICTYFDAGNVLLNAFPEHWVEILGERIKRVHIKDFRRSAGNFDGFVGLMEGDMNWKALMDSLRAIGYDGFITVEVPPLKHAPQLYLESTSKLLDIIFAM